MIPYLDTFKIAAETQSFTETAKLLEVTQAAISQRIAALEKYLGTILFDRAKGRVILNDDGKRLMISVKKIVQMHENIIKSFKALEPAREKSLV